jgi:uncharacterized protein YndB with AHSA1/START domain
MADILHTVSVHATPEEIFRALTASCGLRAGWARESGTNPRGSSLAEFRFGDTLVTMRVADLQDDARVSWKCVDGPPDWIGTVVSFELAPDGRGDETIVRFRHRNWREPTDFMGLCSAKWAKILFALKSLVETPEPDDVYI